MDAQTQSTDVYIRVLEWLHARRKPLVIGLGAVAVIGLVWAIVAWKKGQDETDANKQFFAAPIEAGPRSAPVSAQPLLELAKEYPGTTAGEYAQLLAGDELFNQEKYPEAYQQFSEFIESHPDSTLVPQAKVGVAASLEAEGKNSEAIAKYHDLILLYPSELNIISPAKLTLARLYQEDNKPQQAFELYAELARMLGQNPYDPWASEAQERARLLVAAHPEFLKSQASAAPSGFSLDETDKAVDSKPAARATPQPSQPAPPTDKKSPNLLTIPGVSSNATGKP
jgi:tetratricopeptide (TPR) repeat protein